MTATNQARFKINNTPSQSGSTGDRVYLAAHSESLSVTLETNPSSGTSVRYEIFSSDDEGSPLSSKNAPEITWDSSGTYEEVSSSPNDTFTVQMPDTSTVTYTIRCTVNTVWGSDVFERQVSIQTTNTTPPLRKTCPAETTEALLRGWSDTENDIVDAIESIADELSGGDVFGSGTPNRVTQWITENTVGDSTIHRYTSLYAVNGQSVNHGITDGFVMNQLEINGTSHFDGLMTIHSAAQLVDGAGLYFGNGQDAILRWDTNQTPDTLMLGLGADSNHLIIARMADVGTDFGVTLRTDPTLVMKAADTTAAERTEFSHGKMNVLSGNYSVYANNLVFDSDPVSHEFVGTMNEGSVIAGEGHTIFGQYTSFAAVFGEGHEVNTGHCLVVGQSNTLSPGSASVVGGYYNVVTSRRCAVFGQGNSVSSPHSLVFGSNNTTTDCSYSFLGGDSCVVTDAYYSVTMGYTVTNGGRATAAFGDTNSVAASGDNSLVAGSSNTLDAPHSAIFGYSNNLDSDSSYSLVFGASNDCDDLNYGLTFGVSNAVTADYGLTFGNQCENSHDYAIVHGAFAGSDWAHGRFFASTRLDGATTGVSQCFDGTMWGRHTESTSQVVLTPTGSGSTLPLYCPVGYQISFMAGIHAAYESAGAGYEKLLRHVVISNDGSDIIALVSAIDTQSAGTDGFTWDWAADGGTNTIGLKVTPDAVSAANIVVHVWGGTKLKTSQGSGGAVIS